jgi:hypothetical protein
MKLQSIIFPFLCNGRTDDSFKQIQHTSQNNLPLHDAAIYVYLNKQLNTKEVVVVLLFLGYAIGLVYVPGLPLAAVGEGNTTQYESPVESDTYNCINKTDKSKTRTPEMAGNNRTDFLRDLCFDANLADRVEHTNSYVETLRFNA